MLNWYAMGDNAPSFIDEARERRAAIEDGDDYETRQKNAMLVTWGTSRERNIRAWRKQ